MDGRATHMVLATAALSAFALLLAGPAGAYVPEGDGVHAVGAQSQVRQQAQSGEPGTIPYLSHGIGVDESLFAGESRGRDVASTGAEAPVIPYLSHGVGVDESLFGGRAQVDARHQALAADRDATSAAVALDPAIRTAIEARSDERATAPLPHGIQVVMSPTGAPESLGLTGDSALTRVSAPAPEGLTGDSPATRSPEAVSTPSVSGGSDIDWEAFGLGAGTVALLASGLAGVLLVTRRRHTVGMP